MRVCLRGLKTARTVLKFLVLREVREKFEEECVGYADTQAERSK